MEEHSIGNRAVTYTRTSGKSQDKKLSHAGQDRVIFAYVADKQLHTIKSFSEVGSGLDTSERPEFLEMIAYVLDPANDISHVIFHDLSRFSRGTDDPYIYLRILDEHDIIIHAADDRTNSDDDNDLLWGVRFALNHQQSKDISSLTIRGHNESVLMGNDISPVVAYGYEKYYFEDGSKMRPRWRPHPERAAHVVMMYTMRSQGHFPMAIRDRLEDLGIPPPRGLRWTTGTILKILRSNTYLGYSQVGKTSKSKFPRHRRRRKLVENPNAHPPLVSQELFDRVQALMPKLSRAQRPSPKSYTSPNPLINRVKCANHNDEPNANMVVANSRSGGKKLTCSVKKGSGIRNCSNPDVELDDFLKTVGQSLAERLSNQGTMRQQLDDLNKTSGTQAAEEKDRQASIAKRLRAIEREKDTLIKGLRHAEQEFPENIADFNKALSALNKEKAQLEQQKTDIDHETKELMAFLAGPEGLSEAMAELGMAIDPEDLELTSRFLKTFIRRVEVSDDRATMYYSLPLPDTTMTEAGYMTSAPIQQGSSEILLDYAVPAAAWACGAAQIPDRPGRSRQAPTARPSCPASRPARTTFLLPPDRPGKTETCRRRNPQRPTGRSDGPVPAPASASPKPTPSSTGTDACLPALPPPRSGLRPKSIPRADTSACLPARDPAAPHEPETPRPGSWRSSPSSAVLAGHTHRFHALLGKIAAVEHPHRLRVSQLGAQVFLQASYDRVIVPAGLGEKALHGPGRSRNGFGEILGVATLLGLDQQGLEIVPAVFPPLLASEGHCEERMKLSKRLVNPLEGCHIHHAASPYQSTTIPRMPYYITRRCNTSIGLDHPTRLALRVAQNPGSRSLLCAIITLIANAIAVLGRPDFAPDSPLRPMPCSSVIQVCLTPEAKFLDQRCPTACTGSRRRLARP